MLKIEHEVDRRGLQISSAQALGFGGLLPFWAVPFLPALAAWFGAEFAGAALHGLTIYGAIIVSFMAGGRWAFRVVEVDGANDALFGGFLEAVVPALLAWVIVSLPAAGSTAGFGGHQRLFFLVVLLIWQLFQDRAHARGGGIPDWYMRLRHMLVIGAATPIFLSLLLNRLLATPVS